MKNKSLIESILSLSILNGLNILLPLVTLPYTIKVIGLGNYGAYSIVYSIIQYVLLISSYGFAYSSTQQISQNRDDKEFVNTVFNATICARFILSFIPIIFLGVVSLLCYNITYFYMYILGLGIVIGDNINPIWLFQGLEKMRYLTIVNVLCKTIFTFCVFIFLKEENDFIYLTLLNSCGYVFSGLLSLWIAKRLFKISFFVPKIQDVILQIKEGWYLFLSTLFMNIYRNSNILILSFFVPELVVGIYSGAEKIIKAVQSVISPISNAFYPYFSNKAAGQTPLSIKPGLMNLSRHMAVLLIPVCIVFVYTAPYLNNLFLDAQESGPILLMQLMVPVIFFGSLNYILGIVGLVNMDEKKIFFYYVMISGIFSLLFLLITVTLWGGVSAALAMSLSEVLLFVMCLYKIIIIK